MKKLPKITYKEPMALAKWSVWDSSRKCAWGTDNLLHAIKYWFYELKKSLKNQSKMKHSLTLLALALLVVGCAKDNKTAPAFADVTILPSLVASGSMTKTGAADLLASVTPSGMPTLRVVSTTNTARTYQVTAGEPARLPLDTYRVTGTYTPAAAPANTIYHGAVRLEPSYEVDGTIAVTEETATYSVPAQYSCIAVLVDFRETAQAYIYNYLGNYEVVTDWVTREDYGILFLSPVSAWSLASGPSLIVNPVDTAEHESTTFRLITTGQGGVMLEEGKWYCFSPSGVETASGAISFTFPTWIAGNND